MRILMGDKKYEYDDLIFSLQTKSSSVDFQVQSKCSTFLGSFEGAEANLSKIQKKYPDVEFASLKQTHSSKVVEFDRNYDVEPLADAGITGRDGVAPLIKTADCLPIMIAGLQSGVVGAIHAGWRGVADLIHLKAVELMKTKCSQQERFLCIVGPHIHQTSFEIEEPVLRILAESAKNTGHPPEDYYYRRGNKFHFDLLKLVSHQLERRGINKDDLIHIGGNTVSQSIWNSYRRDKENASRNLNFIFKTTRPVPWPTK